jgi:hypothetical protein
LVPGTALTLAISSSPAVEPLTPSFETYEEPSWQEKLIEALPVVCE